MASSGFSVIDARATPSPVEVETLRGEIDDHRRALSQALISLSADPAPLASEAMLS